MISLQLLHLAGLHQKYAKSEDKCVISLHNNGAGDNNDISIWCNSEWSIRAAFWCVIKRVTGKMWDDVWASVRHKTNRIRQIWSHRIMDYVMVQSVQTGPAIPQVLAGRRQRGSQTKRQQLKINKNILLLLPLLLQQLLQLLSVLLKLLFFWFKNHMNSSYYCTCWTTVTTPLLLVLHL